MKGRDILMSSARTGDKSKDEWRTPQWLFDRCVQEFGPMQVDAAASSKNHLCPSFFSEEHSGLTATAKWAGNVWCNPPYSMLRQFVSKALNELDAECSSITFLIPARTDTKAFQMLANSKHCWSIVFLKGRIKFVGADYGAPFPSAIVNLVNDRVLRTVVRFEDWRTP